MGQHFDTKDLALAHLAKCGFRYLGNGIWEQKGVDAEDGPYTCHARILTQKGTPIVLLAIREVEAA